MLFKLQDIQAKEQAAKAAPHEEKCAKFISEAIESDLSIAIGKIELGMSYHFATDASWSLHDLIVYCFKQTGPADLYFCTYAIKEYQARLFSNMKEAGLINNIYGLIDYRVPIHDAGAYQLLLNNCKMLGKMRTHAKLTVIMNHKIGIAIAGSANLTTNTRADVGVITCDMSIANYRMNWILKQISNEKETN